MRVGVVSAPAPGGWEGSTLRVTVLRPWSVTVLPVRDACLWDEVCDYVEPRFLERLRYGTPSDARPETWPRERREWSLTLMRGKPPASPAEALGRARGLSAAEESATAADRATVARRTIKAAQRRADQAPGRAPGGAWDRSER